MEDDEVEDDEDEATRLESTTGCGVEFESDQDATATDC